MNYQRFAVLGSNSFAGAGVVARLLADGKDVLGINRSPETSAVFLPYKVLKESGKYRFVRADINADLDEILLQLKKFRPQVIVDFAGQGMVAESWDQPEQWYNTNIVSKVKLHDRLRQCDWLERYVRISTPEVYGHQSNVTRETWMFNPSTPYAVSHAAIDMSLKAFHERYAFPVIFTRFANFFGPGQQLYRIIPRTIIYSVMGRKLKLHGGGTSIRAFIYIDDVYTGIVAAVSKGLVGETYHFSPERFISIREAVEVVCEQMNVSFSELVEDSADRPAKDLAYLMDSSKARSLLGWSDAVDFEEGVRATIDWVRGSFDEIKNLPLEYIHKV